MKVRSYMLEDITAEDELAACLGAMSEEMPETLLVTIYGIDITVRQMQRIAKAVRNIFFRAHIIGGRVQAVISGGLGLSRGVSLTFVSFEHAKLHLVTQPMRGGVLNVERLRGWLACQKEVACLMTLWSGRVNAVKDIFAGCGIPVFGGMLFDCEEKSSSFLYANDEIIENGVVCLSFCGRSLDVKLMQCCSWQPIGPTFRITAMDGPWAVRELDGEPFADVYDRYIGHAAGERFIDASLSFPMVMHREDQCIARQPVRCREDGAGEFIADLALGDKVQFAYGDPVHIIYETQRLQKEMSLFQPQGLFMVDCIGRYLILEGNMEHELKNCRKIAPSFGFYSYGELMGHGESSWMLNMSLVMVGMRESSMESRQVADFSPDNVVFSRNQRFISHLVHLVQTTTEALERKNDLLGYQARTDALTKLANRGAIEASIKQALADLHHKFAVIMLDVDNFKGINDQLGHDVGDESLRTLSRAIHSSLRSHDIAGRWGGDEFLILLLGANASGAYKVAERIKAIVGKHSLPNGDRFTLSIGITAACTDDDEKTLFRRVDQALYDAKGTPGKDTIVIR